MNSELEKLKGPVEYIKEAWSIYTKKENFIFFTKIMAVLTILASVIGFISGYLFSQDLNNIDYTNIPKTIGFVAISLIAIVEGLWSQTTIYFSILKMGDSEKAVFKIGYQKIGRFLLISLVIGLIILGGAILLIIPAIIFGIWYSFSVWIVLDKNMGIKEALRTSKSMVKGKFWKILERSVIFGIFTFVVSIVLSLIPYAGSFLLSFMAPLFLLPFYLLYRDLSINN